MNKDLEQLIKESKEQLSRMTESEIEQMLKQQRDSWVRAEMSWPKPKYKWVNGVKVYDSYEDFCNG